jgi:phage terminase large subunit
MTLPNLKIQLPDKLLFFLNKKARYKVAYGGRGAGKSESIARCLLLISLQKKVRILCTRELQNSITDSVHKLLSDLISELKLNGYFHITQNTIKNIYGSEFIFKGLKNNINEIKSLQGVHYVWVEEAERVSENSWEILIPTIRESDSEIWIIFNPESPDSATYTRYVRNPPQDAIITKINYYDNPWFPDVLKKTMEYDKRVNPEKYEWIWEGNPRMATDAQIFKGKFIVEDFDTDKLEKIEDRFFYGADWGFSPDPLAAVRCFMVGQNQDTNARGKVLYIDKEIYRVDVELSKIGKTFDDLMPEMKKGICYGDSARPDIISMLQKEGFNIRPVKKKIGNKDNDKKKFVEAGIDYMRDFEKIIIHPSCVNTINEFKLYSHKVDRNTGEVIADQIVDKYNHIIDSIRYAISTYISPKKTITIISANRG